MDPCQEAERGGRVGPVTRERTAGPPPHEPVWIVGDQRCEVVEGYPVGGWIFGVEAPPRIKGCFNTPLEDTPKPSRKG